MADKNKKIKVLCAMSGGVDSSVAAALLVKQGYDVTGAFMVNYDDTNDTNTNDANIRINTGESCWTGDYQDALRVAAKLGIPLMRLDFVKEYKKTVLDYYMYNEYRKGRTPNPDVLCNKFIKFGAWLDKARDLGFDKFATGHYARLVNSPLGRAPLRGSARRGRGGLALMSAKDANKDQTYFLHQLNQEQLKYVLFPIGGYLKSEAKPRTGRFGRPGTGVRSLAREFGLPNADKEESMGICFVGEVPMKKFLQKEIKPQKGKIVLSSGEIIGEHDGLSFYTIGQRHIGLQTTDYRPRKIITVRSPLTVDRSRPLYVVAKNFSKNELVVGYEDDPLLYKKTAEVSEVNWVGGKAPKFPLNCEVRLRHRQPLQECVVNSPLGRGRGGLVVKFSKPQRAVTPGQFAVFYKKGECLGGGVIS